MTTKAKKQKTAIQTKSHERTQRAPVRVIYQKLAGQWYAFADVGNEIYAGRVIHQSTNTTTPPQTDSPKKSKNTKAA